MSQHKLFDDEGREWMIGYDNPCGGFYATRFLSDEEAERTGEEADVLIGFGKGVSLDVLNRECVRHGLILSDDLLGDLFLDELREKRPLTLLQQLVRGLAEEAGLYD